MAADDRHSCCGGYTHNNHTKDCEWRDTCYRCKKPFAVLNPECKASYVHSFAVRQEAKT